MATLTEKSYEGNVVLFFEPYYSLDTVIIAAGADLKVGHVVGKADSGKWASADPLAVDGSAVAAGVLLDDADAGSADVEARVLTRLATVNGHALIFNAAIDTLVERDTARAQLAAAGIVTRL